MGAEGFSVRAARIVFGDGTWWWRALLVAVAGLVPLIGPFVVVGYYMVFMRQVAWGVEDGLPRLSEPGEIAKRALDGFVVSLVWGLILVIPILGVVGVWIFMSFDQLASGITPMLPWWFMPVVWIPTALLSILSNVALLRTAIYLKPSAGLSLPGIFGLIGRSRQGFWRVTGLSLAVSALALTLSSPGLYAQQRLFEASPLLAQMLLYSSSFLVAAATAPLHFTVFAAYGLWARDTNPATWPPLGQSPSVTGGAEPQTDTANPGVPSDSSSG